MKLFSGTEARRRWRAASVSRMLFLPDHNQGVQELWRRK
jgi:hypothetical protein